MKIVDYSELSRYHRNLSEVEPKFFESTEKIVHDVHKNGDKAVIKYTARFDGIDPGSYNLIVTEQEIEVANHIVEQKYQDVYQYFLDASKNIRSFHEHQLQQSWEFEKNGALLGQKIAPISKVGVYVPGGLAPLPSSVLMNLIPATIAGCEDITLATPPQKDGSIHPLLLTLAHDLGASRILKAGGAQAIAAMAYGTESVPPVYKITGPGNIYVALAKRMVMGTVGIDSFAGPSEVAILCDDSVDPEWIAYDLCAQAEHSLGTAVFLITTSREYLDEVFSSLETILPTLERRNIIEDCLSRDSFATVVKDMKQGFEIINRIAPEHLQVISQLDTAQVLDSIEHAGAIFIGSHTPVACGDYYAGPNHVLPTNGTATFSSPLGVYDFMTRTSYMELSPAYIGKFGDNIATMARFEGLEAHARSVQVRKED